ncbi:MAG: GyrI-like domain-containing protein [Syntrophales bacterium]
MDIQEITLQEILPRTIIYLRCRGPWRQLPDMIEKLDDYVSTMQILTTGPSSGIYYNTPDEVDVQGLEWEVFYPVTPNEPEVSDTKAGIGIRNLPETNFASIFHKGSYQKAGSSYERLKKWIKQEGYKIAGPLEEVYVSTFGIPSDEQTMEIRIPLYFHNKKQILIKSILQDDS